MPQDRENMFFGGPVGEAEGDSFSGRGLSAARSLVLASLLLLSMVGGASAQVFDEDFEDGDIQGWTGDTSKFNAQSTDAINGSFSGELTESSGQSSVEYSLDNDIKAEVIEVSIKSDVRTGANSNFDNFVIAFYDGSNRISSFNLVDGSDEYQVFADPFVTESGWQPGVGYKLRLDNIDYSSETFDYEVIRLSDNMVKFSGSSGFFDSVNHVDRIKFTNNAEDQRQAFVDDIFLKGNQPPSLDSTSISPDPPLIGENTSYSASASDSDGSITDLSLTVFKDGGQVYSDTVSGSSSYSWNDVFSPSSGGSLDARFTATDDAGATTTQWLNRSLTNSAPSVSLSMDSKQFKYDAGYSFNVDASDSYPEEDLQCDVFRNGSLIDEVFLKEGTNSSYTGTARSDLGSHSLKVSCTDNTGNTGTDSQNFEVKAFEIQDVFSPSQVYETENTSYDMDLKTGEMVNSADIQLVYEEDQASSLTVENSGINVLQESLFFRPGLVSMNNSNKDWSFDVDLNLTDFSSGFETVSASSAIQNQSVLQAYHSPEINVPKDQIVEKDSFDSYISFTNELAVEEADISLYQSFNGSEKTGDTSQFTFPVVNDSSSISKTVSGRLEASFKDETVSRPTVTNDSIEGYRKILTDCSTAEYGETGVKALQFNLLNEENRSQDLTGDIDYNFDVTLDGDHSRNYAFENTDINSSSICYFPEFADLKISGPVQYTSRAEQNTNNLLYPDRQYNIFNQSLDSNVDETDLYLLRDELSTPVYFEVSDQGGDPIAGATISVSRYFIGSNSYLTVAKSETDSEGIGTTYMRVNEIYYKYTVQDKSGDVLLETDRQILTCQSSPCTKQLRVNVQEDNPYFTQKNGFEYSTSEIRNDEGNLTGFQASVSHSSDVFKKAFLTVEKQESVTSRKLCEIEANSNPATLVCEFSSEEASSGSITYTLEAETDGNKYLLEKGQLTSPDNIFEDNAFFGGFIIFLMFSMLGLASPKTAILFSTAGVVFSVYIGFYSLSVSALASLVVVAILLVAGGRS